MLTLFQATSMTSQMTGGQKNTLFRDYLLTISNALLTCSSSVSLGNFNEPCYLLRHFERLHNNISSIVEFQRWWVLKFKIFGQKSTYSIRKKNEKFRQWMSVHQKLGLFLENKEVQKLKLQKIVFNTKWSPKLILLNEREKI